MRRGLFEIAPGRPNGYLEYQASQINPTQQLAASFQGNAFAESVVDFRRKEAEDNGENPPESQAATPVQNFVDNRAKMKKRNMSRYS